jgi:hypothetical protein
MRKLEKLMQYLVGKDDEEVSWLLYFMVSCLLSGVLGIIVTLVRFF